MENIQVQDNKPKTPPTVPPGKDPISTEFLYYSSILKSLAPSLSSNSDRRLVVPWIKKLFQPEYHTKPLREKRNRYLLYMIITLMNDEVYGLFRQLVPLGPLPPIEDIENAAPEPAEWETDPMWRETVLSLPDGFPCFSCSVHGNKADCDEDHQFDKILDQEFQFLLYLARPYAAMLNNPDDRTKIAAWLQILCAVHGKACSSMRAIRNDYIMALLGYLNDLRVSGPFKDYPPWNVLQPLGEAARMATETKPITDPTNPEVNEFLAFQPTLQDGAFCYIAVTGDLVTENFS